MSDLWQIIFYCGLAGAAILLGGLIARIEHLRPRWLEEELRHGVIAFGGGVLLSAVALVLVPQGVKELSLPYVVVAMLLGGLAFLALDEATTRRAGSVAQLTAMLADFIPEALALGAIFAGNSSAGILLALLIALQNLPEGFNAYRELIANGLRRSVVLIAFLALAPLGPAAGLTGYFLLSPHPAIVGWIMLFSSGGILYLMFQDIAPEAMLKRRWAPPFGAVLGFLAGLVGHQLLA